jgi:hypothetical protein
MKKHFVVALLVLCTCGGVLAQEEPIPPKRSKMMKVGLFGGFTPAWLFVDMKSINDYVVKSNGAPLSEHGIFMVGGAGSAYIMLVPNLRVGGLGMSGGVTSSSVQNGVRRDTEVHVGFGGVTIEYVVPLVEHLDLAFGSMLGGGGMDIILREDLGGNKTWDQEWATFGSSNPQAGYQVSSISRKLGGSFFVLVPSANVEYAVLPWLAFRLGASYVAMISPSWTLDDKYDLLNVPSTISGKGFMINFGILAGTF